MQRRLSSCTGFVSLILAAVLASASFGQGFDLGQLELPDELNQLAMDATPKPGIKIESRVAVENGTNVGLLTIKLTMNDDWKIYSTTQPAGGPLPTTIYLEPSNDYRLLGTFAPDHPPKIEQSDIFKMEVQTFGKSVSWSVPIELQKPLAANSIVARGYLKGLACAGQCVPFGESETQFEAIAVPSTTNVLNGTRIKLTHADVRSWLSKSQVAPGDTVQLFVNFDPEPPYHVYEYASQPSSDFQATLIQSSLPPGWKSGIGRGSAPVISKTVAGALYREYKGPVTIALPIKIPADARQGSYDIGGSVGFQTCTDGTCDRPAGFAWQGKVQVASATGMDVAPIQIVQDKSIKYASVAAAFTPNQQVNTQPVDSVVQPPNNVSRTGTTTNATAATAGVADVSQIEFAADTSKQIDLKQALLLAFAGGFILNFMPCVLPVIGLKIMSFVDQAGSDRRRIFQLNLWYVFGILSIFWVLAALAAGGMGWGQQFSNQTFSISLIALVFAMALSFLGVWEIPIPGFATSSSATELSSKEGVSGAFFKGIITTLLATPCSAPLFGVAYGFAVQSGSTLISFLIFTVVGLGMGLPYLLIGAFPALIRFLPKPGAWMDTFKQLMGFVLLATVIFLMQNLDLQNVVPTVGLLFGLWFACWWIGRVPFTASSDKRMRAWAISAVIGLAAVAICFSQKGLVGHSVSKYGRSVNREISDYLQANNNGSSGGAITLASHGENELPWEPFSEQALNEMIRNGETVMVDFTADYCVNCRVNEAGVLNTAPVREYVDANGIRTIVADLGTDDQQMEDLLRKLQGSVSIPFLAIFPAGHPENVIRLPSLYTSAKLLGALEQAGASRTNIASKPNTFSNTSTRTASKLVTEQLP